jgi:hypothetical protein
VALCYRLRSIILVRLSRELSEVPQGTAINLIVPLSGTSYRRPTFIALSEAHCPKDLRTVILGLNFEPGGPYKNNLVNDIAPLLLLPRPQSICFGGVQNFQQCAYNWRWDQWISSCKELCVHAKQRRAHLQWFCDSTHEWHQEPQASYLFKSSGSQILPLPEGMLEYARIHWNQCICQIHHTMNINVHLPICAA